MTVEDVGGSGTWEQLHTTECSLCGAVRGEDYDQFAGHLSQHHEWADLGLDADPTVADTPDGVVIVDD